MTELPRRPRFAEQALARGYRAGAKLRVVLHDAESGVAVDVGLREWLVLAAADGTRDIDGLTLAANREGARLTPDAVRGFLRDIAELGWLADGLAEARPTSPVGIADAATGDRPVHTLPGYLLACDGRGACCRFYPTVLFSSGEAAVARALCPEVLDAASRQEQAFFPHRGSDARAGLAVVSVGGRCAYLADDDRCSIHVAGGARAKPLGCRAFPAQFVDDGEALGIGPSLECACVFASIGSTEGEPLVPDHIRRQADLDAAIVVERLGPVVVASVGRVEPIEAHRAWTRAVLEAPAPTDAVAAAWSLAIAVESSGLAVVPAVAALASAKSPDAIEVMPWILALATRAAKKVRESAGWRADGDLAREAIRLVADAALRLVDRGLDGVDAPPNDPSREAFAFRAFVFAHGPARRRAADVALRAFAVEIAVARSLAGVFETRPFHPALREPIAVVFSVVRAHGVGAYVDDVIDGG